MIFLKENSKSGEISSQSGLGLLKVHRLGLSIEHQDSQIDNATNIIAIGDGKTVDSRPQLLLVAVRPYQPKQNNLILMYHFLQFG